MLERLGGNPNFRVNKKWKELKSRLSKDPGNLALVLELSESYIAEGYAKSDPRYSGYAQALLLPWWSLNDPPLSTIFLRAKMREIEHNFNGALTDLEGVLKSDPNFVEALLTQARVLRVTGKIDEAQVCCKKLRKLTTELIATACSSQLLGLIGQAETGYRELLNVKERSPKAQIPVMTWISQILSDLAFQLGKLTEMEAHLRDGLKWDPSDTELLGSLADFLLDSERPKEVVSLLKDRIEWDKLLLRLALAEQRLKSPKLNEHKEMLLERFDSYSRRRMPVRQREETQFIMYLLDSPKQAIFMAKDNWENQRQPIDARLLLESALVAEDNQTIDEVRQWVTKNRINDKKLNPLLDKAKQPKTLPK